MAPLPRPADKGLALVVGGGAAMAAHGSSSSTAPALFMLRGLDDVFGAGAAMDPHKSSSSSLPNFAGIFGRPVATAHTISLTLDIDYPPGNLKSEGMCLGFQNYGHGHQLES